MNQKSHTAIEFPIGHISIIVLSLIINEILVMIFIKALPPLPVWEELLLDSFLLSIILLPVLYFFSFRPLAKNLTKYRLAHEEILMLQRAVESSGEAIFITDLDGLITYINPEFTKLYGYTAYEVIGKTTPRILKSGVMNPENYKYFWATILNKEEVSP